MANNDPEIDIVSWTLTAINAWRFMANHIDGISGVFIPTIKVDHTTPAGVTSMAELDLVWRCGTLENGIPEYIVPASSPVCVIHQKQFIRTIRDLWWRYVPEHALQLFMTHVFFHEFCHYVQFMQKLQALNIAHSDEEYDTTKRSLYEIIANETAHLNADGYYSADDMNNPDIRMEFEAESAALDLTGLWVTQDCSLTPVMDGRYDKFLATRNDVYCEESTLFKMLTLDYALLFREKELDKETVSQMKKNRWALCGDLRKIGRHNPYKFKLVD